MPKARKKKHNVWEVGDLIRLPVYQHDIKVVFTDDADWSVGLTGVKVDVSVEAAHLYVASHASILIFPFKATPGIIAHECWHMVKYMLDKRYAALDNENVAYHLEYMVDECIRLQGQAVVVRRKNIQEEKRKKLGTA